GRLRARRHRCPQGSADDSGRLDRRILDGDGLPARASLHDADHAPAVHPISTGPRALLRLRGKMRVGPGDQHQRGRVRDQPGEDAARAEGADPEGGHRGPGRSRHPGLRGTLRLRRRALAAGRDTRARSRDRRRQGRRKHRRAGPDPLQGAQVRPPTPAPRPLSLMAERITVPAGTARAVTLRAGDRLRIVNVAGKQVADFVAFDAGDVNHALSTLHTLVSLGRLFPTKGDRLRTNRRAPMLEITRDDTGRRSCSDNFVEALRPWKLERHRLPQPVNFFQNMSYPDGRVEFGESLARPGDTVELLALISVIAAVSACPMDLNPISGYRVSDLVLELG